MQGQRGDAGGYPRASYNRRSLGANDSLPTQVVDRMGLDAPTWKTLVIISSATTDADPAHVWRTWKNIEAWPGISPLVAGARWTAGARWRPGSEFVEVLNLGFPLRRARAMQRVVSVDPGRSAEWASAGRGLRTARLWGFESRVGGGTHITAVAVFNGASIGVVKPFVVSRWRSRFQAQVDGLVAMAEMNGHDRLDRRDGRGQERGANTEVMSND